MKRILPAGIMLAAPFTAFAQGPPACGPSGTAECFERPVNLLGGLLMNGQNAYRASSADGKPAVSIGPFAGASLPKDAQFWLSIGPYAFESAETRLSESMAIGPGAGISNTTAGGFFAGISAGASITTQVNSMAIGLDAMRDYWDKSGGLAIGIGTLQDGIGTSNVGIGSLAMSGAYATISVNGTPGAGDRLAIAITSANPCGNQASRNCTTGTPATARYTVRAGDTPASVAAGLREAINGTKIGYMLGDGIAENLHNGFQIGAQPAAGHPNVLKMHTPANWRLSFAYSCAGAGCNQESVAVGPGFTGSHNVVVGPYGLSSPLLTDPQNNVIIGQNTADGTAATDPSNDVFLGDGIAPNIVNGSWNIVSGTLAGNGLTSGNGNVISGFNAGSKLTTGSNNLIEGNGVASTTLRTGNNNVLAGASKAVDTPAPDTDNYMNLFNTVIENTAAPSIGSGFGGNARVVAGASTHAFSVNVGSGGTASSGVIDMGRNPAPHLWACTAVDMTNPAASNTVAVPADATTIRLVNFSRTTGAPMAWAAGDVVVVGPCTGF